MTQNSNKSGQKKEKSEKKSKPMFSFEKVMSQPEVKKSSAGAKSGGAKPNETKPKNTSGKKPGRPPKSTPAVSIETPTVRRMKSELKQEKRSSATNRVTGNANKVVKILPLGGLGEIGKNITLFECDGDMLLVDCGISFPDDHMFGVDLVIPDFTYLIENASKIRGLIVTHGHEDHIGAIPYLLKKIKVPVFGTKLTMGFVQNKLEEHKLSSSTKLNVIKPGEKLRFGVFTVEPISVNHSIPDAVAYAIDTPAGIVLHTGDFKVDYTPLSGKSIDLKTFATYGKKGVLCMMSDSTNAERAGYTESEQKVAESFKRLFNDAQERRIFIASFASNINRIQQIIELAAQHNRKVVFSGRSMEKNVSMALELGYINAKPGVIISMEEMRNFSPDKLVVVTTGSQGEPLAALSRMANGTHRTLTVVPGDFIIISANPIPGNEVTVSRVINGLLTLGADVIYESMYDVHVSGHACAEELKLLLTLVRPKMFLPVHGEMRQLIKHARLAESTGVDRRNIFIPEVGQTLCVSSKGITKGEYINLSEVLVDGLGVGDVGTSVLRDRKLLSEDGLVVIAASIDISTRELLSGPEVETKGFIYSKGSTVIIEEIKALAGDVLYEYEVSSSASIQSVTTKLTEQIQGLLYRRLKRRPMIIPLIMEV